MGAYFGVRKWRNGNPVQEAPPDGDAQPAPAPQPLPYAPGYATNSPHSVVVPVPANTTVTLDDISIRSSDGTERRSSPALLPVVIPDIPYTDSDGSGAYAVYGTPIVCTPAGTPVATTVNGVASDVPDIHVKQGGVDVGTLDPVTGVHTVPTCPPAGDGTAVLKNTGGTTLSTTPVPAEGSVDITAPDGTVRLKDEAGNTIGSSVAVVSGGDEFITAPSAQAQLVDSGSAAIDSPYSILSNDTRIIPVADSVITLPNGSTKNVRATQPYTVPATAPLKFSFSQYDQGSDLWKVTADEAGTYNAYTQDGGSGTITYSKNGGTYTALSGTITLAVDNTIQVKRTTITAAGWSRWQRQVTP